MGVQLLVQAWQLSRKGECSSFIPNTHIWPLDLQVQTSHLPVTGHIRRNVSVRKLKSHSFTSHTSLCTHETWKSICWVCVCVCVHTRVCVVKWKHTCMCEPVWPDLHFVVCYFNLRVCQFALQSGGAGGTFFVNMYHPSPASPIFTSGTFPYLKNCYRMAVEFGIAAMKPGAIPSTPTKLFLWCQSPWQRPRSEKWNTKKGWVRWKVENVILIRSE